MKTAVTAFSALARETGLMLGASAVENIAPAELTIDAELTSYCANGCDNFGRSINCPPQVEGPHYLKTSLVDYTLCIVFKIDIPGSHLLDERRYPVMKTIHHLAASLEKLAVDSGFSRSRGFACGSCQQLFCKQLSSCPALENKSKCLFPDKARPSISGYGINVFDLAQKLNWPMERIVANSDPNKLSTGMLCGLVLVG